MCACFHSDYNVGLTVFHTLLRSVDPIKRATLFSSSSSTVFEGCHTKVKTQTEIACLTTSMRLDHVEMTELALIEPMLSFVMAPVST